MQVIAAPGTKCPKEGRPRDYITDNAPQSVPDTPYYRRLIRDGSLSEVQDVKKKTKKTESAQAEKGGNE